MAKNEFDELASVLTKGISAEERFQQMIFERFQTGKAIKKQYSVHELNKRSSNFSDKLTSKAIKDSGKYLVTENAVLSEPSRSSYHGLYRHRTWLDFKLKAEEDDILSISMQYKTQRDDCNTIHKGECIVLKYKDGKLYWGDLNIIPDIEYEGMAVIVENRGYSQEGRVVDGKNVVHAEFSDHSINLTSEGKAAKKINLQKLGEWVAENIWKEKKNKGAFAKKRDGSLEYHQFDTRMHLTEVVAFDIPSNVKELTLNNCAVEKMKLPEGLTKLKFEHVALPLNKLPKSIKELDFWDIENVEPIFDLRKLPNINWLWMYKCGNIENLIIGDSVKRMHISDTSCVIEHIPRFFDFDWDKKVKFGYSDYFMHHNGSGTRDHYTGTYRIGCKSKDVFVYRDAWGNRHEVSKAKILERCKYNSDIVEWVKNIGNLDYYVKKYNKIMKENAERVFTDDSIEPGCYHMDVATKFRVKDILEFKNKKYVVNYVSRNELIHLVPYKDRFCPGSFIQLVNTDRMERLMIDLFDINRIPYRGWKRRCMDGIKKVGTFNFNTDPNRPIVTKENVGKYMNGGIYINDGQHEDEDEDF